jgi:VacB/RNase II family 3'-5' exoribonuclease
MGGMMPENAQAILQISLLEKIAEDALKKGGLQSEFSTDALAELAGLNSSPISSNDSLIKDLTSLLWASIDNDDSKDLDQLTVAEQLEEGEIKIFVAIADVDSLVKKGSAIDWHAKQNTTSIYTAVKIYPMLPEKLSTDLTSLNPNENRLAVVIEMIVKDGIITNTDIYQAVVRNKAKLTYHSVGNWFEGKSSIPENIAKVPELSEQLKLQDAAAQLLRKRRHENGSLTLTTIKPIALKTENGFTDLVQDYSTRANELIEDFMIAANQTSARFLAKHQFSSIRRVVVEPKRWGRIVAVAEEYGVSLPEEPDSKALEEFLEKAKLKDPDRFPDLSLTIIKLLGRGEYVMEKPGEAPLGHFGLAVHDYSHSTAPNRRYPDLITQRLLKAAINKQASPYTSQELSRLASHCTEKEDIATKVERRVEKSASAMVLSSRINEKFEGIITGVNDKGTWVRIFHPPCEGKLVLGANKFDVGDRVTVKLLSVDIQQGFIDFGIEKNILK